MYLPSIYHITTWTLWERPPSELPGSNLKTCGLYPTPPYTTICFILSPFQQSQQAQVFQESLQHVAIWYAHKKTQADVQIFLCYSSCLKARMTPNTLQLRSSGSSVHSGPSGHAGILISTRGFGRLKVKIQGLGSGSEVSGPVFPGGRTIPRSLSHDWLWNLPHGAFWMTRATQPIPTPTLLQTNMETHIAPFQRDCSLYRALFGFPC